jgi:hypothetical protein
VNRIPRVYLIVLAAVLVAALATAAYLRMRAIETEKAAASCDTPAPPPKPATPPPKIPGFEIEAACGPGETPAKPANSKK